MANLAREQFELAYHDACTACEIKVSTPSSNLLAEATDAPNGLRTPFDPRAMWRRAKALFAMQEFPGCYEVCREALHDPILAQGELAQPIYDLYQRAVSRWFESENGIYDWDMIRDAVGKDHVYNDVASFQKQVAVNGTERIGRGLFATRPIAKGSLAMAEKAFAYAKGEERGRETHINIIHDLTRDAPAISAGEALLEKTLTRLQGMGPQWRSRFFDLHSGDYNTHEPAAHSASTQISIVDGQLVMDTFLVLSIIRVNSMTCGPPYEPDRDSGVWIQASYINHSCDPNCEVSFHGDLLVLRALRDIKDGEQLFLNYVPLKVSKSKRREMLKANWGFECHCGACT